MAETNEVQALEKVSAEVDKSQIKIILSSQCIKAQTFLYDKLRKQSERQKEICKFISSSNTKLETEIQFAEQEIKSLHLAIETIKFGNVELKKHYLLSKERKAEIFERTKIGKKKYESIWLKAKTRYESIPCVKKLIEANKRSQETRASIDSLLNESKQLISKIERKEKELVDLDKECVIELAKFFVIERPKIFESIRMKSDEIKDLSREVNVILNEPKKMNTTLINKQSGSKQHTKQIVETVRYTSLEEGWSNLNKNIIKDSLLLPRLHLQNNDLDILSVKLDQIKKVDLQNTTPIKRVGSYTSFDHEKSSYKKIKTEENNKNSHITSLSNITVDTNLNNSNENVEIKKYSEKKLIHILEDIKLDKNDTYSIIHKLEPNQFQETKYVKSNNVEQPKKYMSPEKTNDLMEIEEMNSSLQHNENVVAPPSQYVDTTQCTQEKKVVSFNFQTDKKLKTLSEDGLENTEGINIKAQSQDNILTTSITSEEGYTTIKEMILKKHNLNVSPQFVYAKNNLRQMQHKGEIVTSKFFENKNENENRNNYIKNCDENIEGEDNELDQSNDENGTTVTIRETVSSPKVKDINNAGEHITGILFNHGPEGIPESLNVSISTTGFDDSEDFPQCIDSSLLLSPKADLTTVAANSGNNEVLSQEVPNFLAGFRKKGLSFFGCGSASEGKPDSSAQNQNSGFNFTFGNDEKKGRGGLFSMFR